MCGDARTHAQNGFPRCDSRDYVHDDSHHCIRLPVTCSEKPAKAGITFSQRSSFTLLAASPAGRLTEIIAVRFPQTTNPRIPSCN